jgi:hypothetical protein
MRIDGLFEYKQAGRKFAAPWKITVRIGTPVTFSPDTDAAAVAVELQRKVADL